MKTYLIYADEGQYCGLHGMYDWDIVECIDEDEAKEIGMEMSYELITSYSSLIDSFEREAKEQLLGDGVSREDPNWEDMISDCIEEFIDEDTQYRIFELKPGFDYSTIDTQSEDWEDIRDIYAVKEI